MDLSRLTHAAAADRIEAFASEGRLSPGAWHIEDEGRELACLLGAIHPDIDDTSACPAHLMPQWMAHLTVQLFDEAGATHAVDLGQRYAAAMRVWGRLDDQAWEGIKTRHLIRCVELALAKAEPVASGLDVWTDVHEASQKVVAALRAGDANLLEAAWTAAWTAETAAWTAETAARAAARTAAWTARAAARTAAWTARAAARTAAWTAETAETAARAAARTAETAETAARAAGAADSAAGAAANHQLFTALLDDIRQQAA